MCFEIERLISFIVHVKMVIMHIFFNESLDTLSNYFLLCCHVNRYFIVIDDIWDTESWNMIKCALIDNDNGSRIMTTSRIYDVSTSSDEVCKLKPLSDHQSKKLFYARLNGKSTCTFYQPDDQSTKYSLHPIK